MSSSSSSSATSSTDITKTDKDNRIRFETVVMPFVTAKLCELFQSKWRARVGRDWTVAKDNADFRRIYKKVQFDEKKDKHLLQSFASKAPTSWDITLLTRLLEVMAVGAEIRAIQKIRIIRNDLSHDVGGTLSTQSFEKLFSKIKASLVLLNVDGQEIDKLEKMPLDDDTYVGISVDQNAAEIANAHAEAGNRSMAVDKFSEACESFTRALQMSGVIPESLTGKIFLRRCVALEKLQRHDAALQDALQAARLTPSDYKVHLKLAQLRESMNEYRLACADYESAKSLAPDAMKLSIADKLTTCRSNGDHWERKEHMNLQFSSTSLVSGSAAADSMNASLGIAKPDGTPLRDWDLPASVLEKLPLGQRLIIRAKQAQCNLCEQQAYSYYLQAAQHNEPEAMYNLAVMLSKGVGVPAVDRKAALAWARKAIACPIPDQSVSNRLARMSIGLAHSMLGNWYFKEIELPKNDELALKHWLKGADLGASSACNMLGLCYENSQCGVQRSIANAVDYYRMACDSGLPANESMVNMASLWLHMHSNSSALRWLESALKFGNTSVATQVEALRKRVADSDDSKSLESILASAEDASTPIIDKLLEMEEQFQKIDRLPDVRLSAFDHEALSLESLQRLVESKPTPYLRLLFDAKRILAHAIDSCLRGVNTAYVLEQIVDVLSIPDSGIVTDQLESTFLHNFLSKHIELVQRMSNDEQRVTLLFQLRHYTMSQIEQIEWLRSMEKQFPNSICIQRHLGCLYFFRGQSFDAEAGYRHLTRAISIPTRDTAMKHRQAMLIDLNYLIGAGLFQSLDNNRSSSSNSVLQSRAKAYFTEFLKLADGYGHRKEPLAHYHLALLISLTKGANNDDSMFDEMRLHYERGVKADSNLPRFLYSQKFTPRDTLKSILAVVSPSGDSKTTDKAVVVRVGGEALKIAGIDKRWFRRDNILLNQLRTNYTNTTDFKSFVDVSKVLPASNFPNVVQSTSSSSSSSAQLSNLSSTTTNDNDDDDDAMMESAKAKNLKELATKRLDDAKKEHARLSDELARVTEQQQRNELQDQVMHAFYAIETAENDLHSLSPLSENATNTNNTSSSSSSSSMSSSSSILSSPSSIMIDEIVSFCEDRVFRGRCLKVVIVAPPVLVLRNLAVRFVVEDGRRFAMPMMIQNTESVRSKLSVGTVLTISDPRCSISNDFTKQILIASDVEKSLSVVGQLSLCWHCLKCIDDMKQCSRCKVAKYCSIDCQQQNWKSFHKNRCVES